MQQREQQQSYTSTIAVAWTEQESLLSTIHDATRITSIPVPSSKPNNSSTGTERASSAAMPEAPTTKYVLALAAVAAPASKRPNSLAHHQPQIHNGKIILDTDALVRLPKVGLTAALVPTRDTTLWLGTGWLAGRVKLHSVAKVMLKAVAIVRVVSEEIRMLIHFNRKVTWFGRR